MSRDKTPTGMKAVDAMLKRREAIQSSGVPPRPLKEPWQQNLRILVDRLARERGWPPDEICLQVMAEMLRWMRDEQGYEPDHAAGLAASFAEVFPKYGGVR